MKNELILPKIQEKSSKIRRMMNRRTAWHTVLLIRKASCITSIGRDLLEEPNEETNRCHDESKNAISNSKAACRGDLRQDSELSVHSASASR